MRDLVWVMGVVCAILAECPIAAQQSVPVRDLGPVVARIPGTIGVPFGVTQFSDGHVLVDDALARRLMLFDTTLTTFRVVADTTGAARMSYGRTPMPLVPYIGDSVLFIDLPSSSMLVIGPTGAVARTVAPPKVSDLLRMRTAATGVDARGRLYYRGALARPRPAPGAAPLAPSDSAPIVRADFDTRSVDTVGMMYAPSGAPPHEVRGADGKVSYGDIASPVTVTDEWVVHADGSVAILRERDYHIDWIAPDGSRSSSPKMLFDWRRLTDADKQALIDSARRAWNAMPPAAHVLTMAEASSMMRAVPQDQWAITTLPDGTKGVQIVEEFAPLSEMPDYVPPIRAGAMKADPDGRLWILPATSAHSRKGGLVYDIVNRGGEVYDRVELPAGRSIIGFGRGGAVYLMSGNKTDGFVVERARFK